MRLAFVLIDRYSWMICAIIAATLAVVFGGDTFLQWRAAVIVFVGYLLLSIAVRSLARWGIRRLS